MVLPAILALMLSPMAGGGSYFEDFNDGIADGWLPVHGEWSVIFGIYRGIGRHQANSVHNISYVPQTQGADYSVAALMSSDTGFDDVSKMLVLRYNDPNNFYFVNFRAGWRHDVVVERVLAGVRTLITPEFLYNIPEHGQADWKHVRADVIGDRLIAYFEGVPVCDISLPTILIPSGAAGINVFSSGGGDEEVYVDEFSCAMAQFATALSLEKIVGARTTGGLANTAKSDNSYFTVTPQVFVTPGQPNAQVVWTGQITLLPIREATVRFEGSAATGATRQKVELWDWLTPKWVQVDSRVLSATDVPLRFVLDGKFVNAAGQVKVRASYFAVDRATFLPRIDEINVHAVAE